MSTPQSNPADSFAFAPGRSLAGSFARDRHGAWRGGSVCASGFALSSFPGRRQRALDETTWEPANHAADALAKDGRVLGEVCEGVVPGPRALSVHRLVRTHAAVVALGWSAGLPKRSPVLDLFASSWSTRYFLSASKTVLR